MSKRSICLYIAALLVLTTLPAWVAAGVDNAAETPAIVTFVEGSAWSFAKDGKGRPLAKGDQLGREHEIRVDSRSRIEIRFPDGTVMRLYEGSRLATNEVRYDRQTESKSVKVNLIFGRLWAKVKKLVTPDSSVEVNAGNAVAGVRGTVYRVNVDEDKSAMVRVYDGSVYVAGHAKDDSGRPSGRISAPVPVPGPQEVEPPMHEVTMEEWRVIVRAMQQITISSNGAASPPRDFDAKADADDWVKWNQKRDKQAGF